MERGPRQPFPEKESLDPARLEGGELTSPLSEEEHEMVVETVARFTLAFRNLEGEGLHRQIANLERHLSDKLKEGRKARELAEAEAKKQERGLMDTLSGKLRSRFARFAVIGAAAVGSYAAGSAIKRLTDHGEPPGAKTTESVPSTATVGNSGEGGEGGQENEKSAETRFDLDGLDKQATPERMHRLLYDTLPKGWAGKDISVITYADVEGYVVPNIKPVVTPEGTFEAHALAAAYEDRAPLPPTTIRFFKGMKGLSRDAALGATVGHESAHANDWERDGDMPKEVREKLHADLLARIDAPDRFKSTYVESIKKTESEQRVAEYWAEICEEYLTAEDPEKTMPHADLEIIKNEFSRIDPSFDRDKALEKRRGIFREMRWAEMKDVIVSKLDAAGVTVDDTEVTINWIGERAVKELPYAEKEQQPVRVELFKAVKVWAVDPARKDFSAKLAVALGRREALLDVVRTTEDVGARERAMSAMATALKDLQESRQRQPSVPGLDTFEESVARLVDGKNLVVGTSSRGGILDSADMAQLRDPSAKRRGWDPGWVVDAFSWTRPYEENEGYEGGM